MRDENAQPESQHGTDPIVIVETDRAQQGYDPRMAALLEQIRQSHQLPFPRAHGIDEARLASDYRCHRVDDASDPAWHFELRLPRTAEREPGGHTSAATLARFRLVAPQASIEIEGHPLAAEARVTDWLDRLLAQLSVTPVSSRPQLTASGIMGDVLATWPPGAESFVGRFSTVRFGDRVFVVALRSPAVHYRQLARDYVLALSSLATVQSHLPRQNRP